MPGATPGSFTGYVSSMIAMPGNPTPVAAIRRESDAAVKTGPEIDLFLRRMTRSMHHFGHQI